jgi:hypothetical protein
MSARRRLLGMLLVLAIGTGALAATKMAAWWVVIPSAVMLLGYVAVLRAAAKADTERREPVRTRATARPAPAPAVARATAPAATRPAATAARRAAPPAPAPAAEVIDISASLIPADEEFYDQYADAKRRAVGD